MPLSLRRPAAIFVILFGLWSGSSFAYPGDGNVRGVVVDESGGVLPGVTVVVTSADGRVLATTVTDGAGRYRVGPLAAGRVTVTFRLEGFSEKAVPITVASDEAVLDQRLVMAPQSETVVVVGKVPLPPPLPPPPPPPPIRPRPVTIPVPEHDKDSTCGPAKLGAVPEIRGRIRSRIQAVNGLYSEGDELVIDRGARDGLHVGQNFVVRRTYRVEWEPHTEIGEHAAGLVQIVGTELDSAVAVVIYACGEIMVGDRLTTFRPQPRRASATGKPDYIYAAKILFPDLGQLVGGPRSLMVIDQGAGDGIHVGQRVTIFRRQSGGRPPLVLGDAVVVATRGDSATIRVERATDAIVFGDWAAPRR